MTIRGRTYEWGTRSFVMGIVNVSPESFSGDGLSSVAEAVAQAKRFEAEGADFIDIGAMSTRPNFQEIGPAEEIERAIPAVRAVVEAVDLPVSIDTYRAEVAAAALEAGAHLINDIWGFRADPEMAALTAQWNVPAVLMHNQRNRPFHDVIGDITTGFEASLALADAAGVPRANLVLDPGFGFGWTVDQNFEMLRRLGELRRFGLPLLAGTSRKSSIGAVLELPEDQRVWGTAATVAIAIANGADVVRVHDVAEMMQVRRIADAIVYGVNAAQ